MGQAPNVAQFHSASQGSTLNPMQSTPRWVGSSDCSRATARQISAASRGDSDGNPICLLDLGSNFRLRELPNTTTMTTSSAAPSGDLAIQILQALSTQSPLLSSDAFPTIPFQDVKAALDRLASRSMVAYETIDREEAILEPEAQQIAEHGSHEARVFEALRNALEGLTIQELEQAIGDKTVTKVGQGKAFKEKWISKSKDGKLVATVCHLEEDVTKLACANYRQ